MEKNFINCPFRLRDIHTEETSILSSFFYLWLDPAARFGDEVNMRVFDPLRIPPPISQWPSWPSEIVNSDSIDLEIGAGAGLHAIRRVLNVSDRTLVAIEKTSKCQRLLRRWHNHGQPKNLIAIRADAILWVAHNAPPSSIKNCFILYPNPYPKHSQRNLRWHNMPFMGFLKTRLRPDGKIVTATNNSAYRSEAREVMTGQWGFQLLEESVIDCTTPPRTHFEKKYLERGEVCWHQVYVSN
jgi:tRNA (guanine-N7-)-methyltransferase